MTETSPKDPNLEALYRTAVALDDLRDDLVFVGGAVVGMLITDEAAPIPRPTADIDVIIETASRLDYQSVLAPKLENLGFSEDMGTPEMKPVICRWRYEDLVVDVMPTEPSVLGFANR